MHYRLVILLATAVGLGASQTASAADMPVKAPPVAVVAAAYNWTGFYSASTIGVGWERIHGDFVFPPPDKHNVSGSKAWYGSHVGYQYQWDKLVVGIEGTYAVPLNSGFLTSTSPSADCFGATPVANRFCDDKIRKVWGVGGRLGWAGWDRVLFYGTGGYARGKIESQDRVANTGVVNVTDSNQTYWHSGWYAGAGFDIFLMKVFWSDLILGFEYRHYDLGSVRHFPVNVAVGAVFAADQRDIRATMDVVSARLTFKFNPWMR